MSWILRKKLVTGMLGCLIAGWVVMAVNAEDKQSKNRQKKQTSVSKADSSAIKPKVKRSIKETKPIFYPELTKSELKIQEALNANTECEFLDVSFTEAMNSLSTQHGINMFLDSTGFEERDLRLEKRVNFSLSDISLKSALDIILKPRGMDYVVENEFLKISTVGDLANTFKVRIYPVADLCDSPEDYQALENVIRNTCLANESRRSKSYSVDDLVIGGPGKNKVTLEYGSASISAVPQCRALVINDTDRVHETIVELLTQLRQVRQDQVGISTEKKKK